MNLLFINIKGTTQTHTIKHKLNNNVKSVLSIIYMKVQRKSLKITHHIQNLFTISPSTSYNIKAQRKSSIKSHSNLLSCGSALTPKAKPIFGSFRIGVMYNKKKKKEYLIGNV